MNTIAEIHPRRRAALREFLSRCYTNGVSGEENMDVNRIKFNGPMAEFARKLGFSGAFTLKTNISEGYIVKEGHCIFVVLNKFVDALGEPEVNGILDGSVQVEVHSSGPRSKASHKAPTFAGSSKSATIDSVASNLEDAVVALKFVERTGVGDIFLKQPAVGILFTKIFKMTKECIEVGQPQYSLSKTKSMVGMSSSFMAKPSIEAAKAALALAKAAQTDKPIQSVLDKNPDVFLFVTEIIFGMNLQE